MWPKDELEIVYWTCLPICDIRCILLKRVAFVCVRVYMYVCMYLLYGILVATICLTINGSSQSINPRPTRQKICVWILSFYFVLFLFLGSFLLLQTKGHKWHSLYTGSVRTFLYLFEYRYTCPFVQYLWVHCAKKCANRELYAYEKQISFSCQFAC